MKLHQRSLLYTLLLFVVFQVAAQSGSDYNVKDHYTKTEVDIPMRDGTKLHTTIYAPKDTSKKYPIIMQRTPYSSRPYGEGQMRSMIGPNQ